MKRPSQQGIACAPVAQTSKSAVSPISKSAGAANTAGLRVGKPATQQVWKPAPRNLERGVALVITLILLSVITFMAVTFLVVSRNEGQQVDTTLQGTISKQAANGMAQQAISQLAALAMTNGYAATRLVVSTNYVSPFYDPTPTVRVNLNNVNYNYANGQPLTQADQQQMLNNLLYLPRAPVFISTNRNQANPEFRFYHDLNGNGMYDTNGFIPETANGVSVVPQNFYVGDPEWIGFLEHPDLRHSASNYFLSRGAFIAIPIGNALDVNYIHNQAKFLINSGLAANPYEGFFRNEGVGSWEINFAAFLQTLNTNVWGAQISPTYSYRALQQNSANQGLAFYDAASILQYRNNGNYAALSPFQSLYGLNAFNSYLVNGGVDAYAAGQLMTGVNPQFINDKNYPAGPWSGADYPVRFIRPRDLMTLVPSANGLNSFTNRIYQAGLVNPANIEVTNSYNRYTFYRMLSQMGFDSAPEPAPYPIGGGQPGISQIVSTIPPGVGIGGQNQMSFGTVPEAYPYLHSRKMSLNFDNIHYSATNFAPWTPAGFFTNAADRLLRAYFPTNFAVVVNGNTIVTNLNVNFIPIYPVNYYTPAVHRMLQLAANMYDASTNKAYNASTGTFNPAPDNFDYPSVFRPIYNKTGSGANAFVYISGYYEVSNNTAAYLAQPLDLRRVSTTGTYDVDSLQNQDGNHNDYTDNIYGIPYAIGARQGFPNFNRFVMTPVVQINRRLQITRVNASDPISKWHTNVMYILGVSNAMGVECWNSYTNYYGRNVRILATNDMTVVITNNLGLAPYVFSTINTNVLNSFGQPPVIAANLWPGSPQLTSQVLNSNSLIAPLVTNVVTLPNALIQQSPPVINTNLATLGSIPFLQTSGLFIPQFGAFITNRLRVIMQDMPNGFAGAPGRIIDYVELNGLDSYDNINTDLATLPPPAGLSLPAGGGFWGTNIIGVSGPAGFYNQIQLAAGTPPVSLNIWNSIQANGNSTSSSKQAGITAMYNFISGADKTNLSIQVPFAAFANFTSLHSWSVNDPLVHYTTGDLNYTTSPTTDPSNPTNTPVILDLSVTNPAQILSLRQKLPPRYQPWNNTDNFPSYHAITTNQVAYKDPMIRQSADWQFPTNKYPNIGWLGRVHRGTPWQTVYLKSALVDGNTWQAWSSNPNLVDATNSQPFNDWRILDLFTTAPNDNASRGQLSVNQPNAAAWAAVLDGVMVLSNNFVTKTLVNFPIDTTQPAAQNIIAAINAQQAKGSFTSVGQVLTVPQLTVASPYLVPNDNDTNLTDAVYERIPQQIMSLLRVGTPRYVIFAYGQSLKPADHSIVQSGQFFGMPTNYQITGEVMTRTVVRFDNMFVPGQPLPGTRITNALPIQGRIGTYALVTNTVPPMRAVTESFSILGPDQ